MSNIKYAIRFPDLQGINCDDSKNIFSEQSIIHTTNTFMKTFDAFGSLLNFVVQKNRTNELSRQIDAQKRALDVEVDNLKEQEKIRFKEYTERLQIQLQNEKEKLKIKSQILLSEGRNQVNRFSITFEESMQKSQILHHIIEVEYHYLDKWNGYIDMLADNYSRRKEYVFYCECQRQSMELINQYLNSMI